MRTVHLVLIAVLSAITAGCVPTEPFRTHLAPPAVTNCPSSANQPESVDLAHSNHERTAAFDLYFVEFDELGLLYPQGLSEAGTASSHIQALMDDLGTMARAAPGLSIIVYVHGWKHNASTADPNVQGFRNLLSDAALVERAKEQEFGLPRHCVVGIYVSWRGDSLDLPEPLKSLSFWDRKNTAERVAEGESRTLFARLRGFEAKQNLNTNAPLKEKKIFTILMGHSFGGLILFNSISAALINYLYDNPSAADSRDLVPRFGDMVILANPAIEAARYTPLHRAATSRGGFDRYQAPIFVSITSTADWATGIAFPLGRDVSTIFETKLSEEEREVNRETMGHVDNYITHDLKKLRGDASVCPGWAPVKPDSPGAMAQEEKNLDLEKMNSREFFGANPDTLTLARGWTRSFCGNAILSHLRYEPNSPIWNVQTEKDIVPDHNDITEPIFVNFVRQLYHDAVMYPLIVEQKKAQAARQEATKKEALPSR